MKWLEIERENGRGRVVEISSYLLVTNVSFKWIIYSRQIVGHFPRLTTTSKRVSESLVDNTYSKRSPETIFVSYVNKLYRLPTPSSLSTPCLFHLFCQFTFSISYLSISSVAFRLHKDPWFFWCVYAHDMCTGPLYVCGVKWHGV